MALSHLALLLAQSDPPTDISSGELSDWIQAAIVLAVAFAIATVARGLIRRLGTRTRHRLLDRADHGPPGLRADRRDRRLHRAAHDRARPRTGAGRCRHRRHRARLRAAGHRRELHLGNRSWGSATRSHPGTRSSAAITRERSRSSTCATRRSAPTTACACCCPTARCSRSPLTNLTVNGNRRTDFSLGVAYGTDLDAHGRSTIEAVARWTASTRTLRRRHGSRSWRRSWITIRVRYWHAPRIGDMWRIRSAAIIAVVNAADRAGIDLPYERTVVEVVKAERPD